MQDTVTETKEDSDVEMASPDSPSVELPPLSNNPPTSFSTGTAPNPEDHERILEKMKSLTSHCQHYIELAYSTHLNALNIQAYDHRIGVILLALLELVAQRRIYSERHQGYADQMAATLQQVEGMGSVGEATGLRDAQANIDDAMRAVWGADPITPSAIPAYQEVPDHSGQPVMVIPLFRPFESKLISDAVKELGKCLAESPMSAYRALFASDEVEEGANQESVQA
ncbi:hypothetical protein H1R20_g10177, partial [Candolleomyces eurysporus]